MPTHSYRALKAWNRFLLGRFDYNLDRAQNHDAPEDAIFLRHNEFPSEPLRWATLKDLSPDHRFHAFLAKFKE